jgi:hypothetical protein
MLKEEVDEEDVAWSSRSGRNSVSRMMEAEARSRQMERAAPGRRQDEAALHLEPAPPRAGPPIEPPGGSFIPGPRASEDRSRVAEPHTKRAVRLDMSIMERAVSR